MVRQAVVWMLLGLWSMVGLAEAQGGSAPEQADRSAIRQVIEHQIEAFSQDDFERAFRYASPEIQKIFGSAQRFEQMVRRGFPMVHRAHDIQFLTLRIARGLPVQRVQMSDAQGRVHVLDYYMQRGENGWTINGVETLDASLFAA